MPMKKKVDVDPKTIDLEEAYCMCAHKLEYSPPDGDGKPLTCKSESFPLIIDFDELDSMEPPPGYTLSKTNRDIEIMISTFAGYCPGAKHYYCDILFHGPYLKQENKTFSRCFDDNVGDLFGLHKIELYRRLTKKDLSDKSIDWDFYDIGYLTHRWNDIDNAIACAKKVISLRFKNYGKVTVTKNI